MKRIKQRLYIFSFVFLFAAFPPLVYSYANKSLGFSVYQTPKYKEGFKNFSYVYPNAPKGGTLRLSSFGKTLSFNPYSYKIWPVEGLNKTFCTLMAKAEDEIASAYGYLAQSIEFTKDNKSFTFYLRPEAVFHDGTPIKPKDVIATIKALNTSTFPLYRGMLKNILKIKKVKKNGVQFILNNNNARSLAFFIGTNIFILSKKDLDTFPLSTSTKHIYLGSGPYKLLPPSSVTRIEYIRVSPWWGKNLPVNKGKYNFNKISYDFFHSPATSLQALKNGRLDMRQIFKSERGINIKAFPSVKKGKIKFVKIPHPRVSGMAGVLFNLRNPVFQDIRVRKALFLMFDFQWINKNIFNNKFTRLTSYHTGSIFQASKTISQQEKVLLKPFEHTLPKTIFKTLKASSLCSKRQRIKEALKLLKSAGWSLKGKDLISEKTGAPLHITILLPSPFYTRFMTGFKKNLEVIGIQVQLLLVDKSTYIERLNNHNFDMLAGAFFPFFEIPNTNLHLYWHSKYALKKSSQNLAGVQNPAIDTLLDKIKEAKSHSDLIPAMRALDRVLINMYYLIPQWYAKDYIVGFSTSINRPTKTPYHGFGLDTWWFTPNNKE